MHLKYRNVNEAFRGLVKIYNGMYQVGGPDRRPTKSDSRNGSVLYYDEPVIITYTHPHERVLFNQARDANPFFHLYESLWMLAGRNDVAPLAYYANNIKQYSDDGNTFNGAYGYRWRHSRPVSGCMDTFEDTDQLKFLINHLRDNPTSRRAVLQMWNVEDDLLKIDGHEMSRDTACNLSVCFSIRSVNEGLDKQGVHKFKDVLDMTVFNRSNDLIWGALGANVVHFSILQEYMAAHIGVEVGVYNQISNNLHVYESNWKPEEWLSDDVGVSYDHGGDWDGADKLVTPSPLVKDPKVFDEEVLSMVGNAYGGSVNNTVGHTEWKEPFLEHVAKPMFCAFERHKERDYEKALIQCSLIKADDWRIAAQNWITKRRDNYLKRKERPEHVHEETC